MLGGGENYINEQRVVMSLYKERFLINLKAASKVSVDWVMIVVH